MTYTAYGLIAYMIIVSAVILIVGHLLHKWGICYLKEWMESSIAYTVNNALLICYYLINIGYAMLLVKNWQKANNLPELIEQMTGKVGYIIILLGVMHYINLIGIQLYRKYKIRKAHS